MITITIILISISIVFFLIAIYFYYLSKQKVQAANRVLDQAQKIIVQKGQEQEAIQRLQEEIDKLENNKKKLLVELEQVNKTYESEKNNINEKIQLYKDNTNNASHQYILQLENRYKQVEQQYDKYIQELKIKKQNADAALEKLQASLSAGVQAQLREKEKENKINFYKLVISDSDLQDIESLENLKKSFHQPIILSKLIWSTYFQKETTALCNRIFGTKTVCGIYKITNLITQEVYIGQSVNTSNRIKEHIRAGLGIDASTTNKLYANMQKYHVWNFTFELLEECPREQLNEKEKMWIHMYSSDKFGMNSTKGNN